MLIHFFQVILTFYSKLPRFLHNPEQKASTSCNFIQNKENRENKKYGTECTLKNLITTETESQQIVYERLFPKSTPQQERDTYFLTEMYNIKGLLRRQTEMDEGMDLKLKTSILKNTNQSSQSLSPYYTKKSPTDQTLIFESRFESGNLCLAIKVSDSEYNLFIQNDVNTQGYTQWYFFRVTNTTSQAKIKFNILNFVFIKYI